MFRPYRALLLASLAALAVHASSGGSAPLAPPTSARLPTMADDDPLSIMTYNVKGLPWPLAFGREEALAKIADRLAAMRAQGAQPHILLLQEAFTPEAARIAARAGYVHVAAGPDPALRTAIAATPGDIAYLNQARWDRGERMDKQVGSGLLILSDYPIVGIDRMAFPDFACAGLDCLANKGVLIAHVAVPGIATPVSIVNTHLNARKAAGVTIDRTLRAFDRQTELAARFVAAHVPAGRPLILGGDMNIGRDAPRGRTFFGRFAQAGLGFVAPHWGGLRRALEGHGAGEGAPWRDLRRASDHGKDWLFARDGADAPMPVLRAAAPFGADEGDDMLSDHVGYMISYAVPGRAPLRFAARPAGGA